MSSDALGNVLAGFSLRALGDEVRSGESIAIQGYELERYSVGDSTVVIVNHGGVGRYIAVEPGLTEEERHRLSALLRHLYLNLPPEDAANPSARMTQNLIDAATRLGFLDELMASLHKYEYYMRRELDGHGRLDVLTRDENIEDIKCTGPARPVVVKHKMYSEFDWLRTNLVYATEEETENAVQKVLQKCGKIATTSIPIVDARTPENHRVSVRFGHEVSVTGTGFTMRKFPSEPISITTLVQTNTLTSLMVAYLWVLLEAKAFTMILGPTASGKTTLMNTLISLTNPNLAVCTVEDNPELVIPNEIWDRLISRRGYSIAGGQYDIDLLDLTKHTLRLTPDFVVVGEVRGEEIQALIQSALTGHGALCSFHSDGVEGALVRMSSPPMNVPLGNLMQVWAFATMNRVRREEGKVVRRVVSVTELQPKAGGFDQWEVFSHDARSDTFSPSSAQELIQGKSFRLKQAAHLFGWDGKELTDEVSERSSYIEGMVSKRVYGLKEVSEAIGKFYLEKYRLKR